MRPSHIYDGNLVFAFVLVAVVQD